MTDYKTQYKQAQKKLEELDDELKKRSDAWKAIHPGQKPPKKIEDLIITETNALLYYLEGFRKAKEKEQTDKENILKSKQKLTDTYLDTDITYKSNAKKKKSIIDTHIREVQIKKYDNYKYGETIHILYVLCFVFLLCGLIIIGNMNNLINNYILLLSIIVIIILFLLYIIKILIIDNVNINNFIYHKYDYNKPTEEEIRLGHIQDTMFSSGNPARNNNNDNCNIKEIEVTNDPNKTRLLQNVETDIGPDKDGSSCSV